MQETLVIKKKKKTQKRQNVIQMEPNFGFVSTID